MKCDGISSHACCESALRAYPVRPYGYAAQMNSGLVIRVQGLGSTPCAWCQIK